MTAVLEQTYLASFVSALPPHARLGPRKLNITAQVIANAHRAEQHGWTTQQLVEECMRNHNGAINTGGIIAHRLASCAEAGPAATGGKTAKVHDGCCESGWLYPDVHGVATVTKCSGRVSSVGLSRGGTT